jgi:hypothetical protein
MKSAIAWLAMIVGVFSLLTVMEADEPEQAVRVNPTIALQFK